MKIPGFTFYWFPKDQERWVTTFQSYLSKIVFTLMKLVMLIQSWHNQAIPSPMLRLLRVIWFKSSVIWNTKLKVNTKRWLSHLLHEHTWLQTCNGLGEGAGGVLGLLCATADPYCHHLCIRLHHILKDANERLFTKGRTNRKPMTFSRLYTFFLL